MPNEVSPVPGEPTGSVAPATAPANSGVTPAVTTTPTPTDAETRLKDTETRLAEAQRIIDQREQDIRNIKSSLQRRESQLTNDFKARERDFQQQLDQIRMSSMDEDERAIYTQQLTERRLAEMQDENASIARERDQAQAMTNAYIYFTRLGVTPDKLVLDQGYEAMYQSGMEELEGMVQNLRTQTAAPVAPPTSPTPPNPPAPPTAPPVVTTTTPPAGSKPTWAELVAKYGSEEAVYSLVEQQRLPPDIIPGYK